MDVTSSHRLSVLMHHIKRNETKEHDLERQLGVANCGYNHSDVKVSSTNTNHFQFVSSDSKVQNVSSSISKKRHEVLKWNGWGYNDSKFHVKIENGQPSVYFTGDRYIIGNLHLPHFGKWIIETLNADLQDTTYLSRVSSPSNIPSAVINEEFFTALKSTMIQYSTDADDRLFRSHGHTVAEMFTLREEMFARIPDIVVFPSCHDEVCIVVKLASKYNVAIIPFGGGTSVTGALLCSGNENRMIASLDTSQMSKILWIDEKNLTACIESGINGQTLEKLLAEKGYTVGHEPDSYEFSSLGGWVATRASGMKKNIYGNIEDLVIKVKVVTPRGTVEKHTSGPRISAGPDINHFILGSEGTLGVITEVTVKIRPIPKVKRYGSIVFPDFESGVNFLREIALNRCQPASVRLLDNDQFRFGQALKLPSGAFMSFLDGIKRFYVSTVKGFNENTICVATLLFEGLKSHVDSEERVLYSIAKKHNGISAGETNGERGYILTFVIAYIRDFGLDYGILSESFETSVPWNRVLTLCTNVKHRVSSECQKHLIKYYIINCRVTQTYDAGVCVYFYFAFNYRGINNPVHVYEEIENCARDEILACGGSISHHHGVGKIRLRWMPYTLSEPALGALKAVKEYFDPNNIFAAGNLV